MDNTVVKTQALESAEFGQILVLSHPNYVTLDELLGLSKILAFPTMYCRNNLQKTLLAP